MIACWRTCFPAQLIVPHSGAICLISFTLKATVLLHEAMGFPENDNLFEKMLREPGKTAAWRDGMLDLLQGGRSGADGEGDSPI